MAYPWECRICVFGNEVASDRRMTLKPWKCEYLQFVRKRTNISTIRRDNILEILIAHIFQGFSVLHILLTHLIY